MKIKWLGHSSFLITTSDNTRIITDPYDTVNGVNLKPLNESADVVLISHHHFDHANSDCIKGNPKVLSSSGTSTIKGVEFRTIPTFHDEHGGADRGANLIFCLKADDITVCHFGDLGHLLNKDQIVEIGNVDIMMIPVGGFFTIDAEKAARIAEEIKPKLIIPMHFKTPKLDFPIDTVDKFIKGKSNVRKTGSSEINIDKNTLPAETEILILETAY
jgi:L-ascorbate metabolism protein UlaG (beta-lactamase superfamily)